MRRYLIALGSLGLTLACGDAPPPATPAAIPSSTAVPARVAPPPPVVKAVAPPDSLLATARIGELMPFAQRVMKAANMPVSILEQLGSTVIGDAMAFADLNGAGGVLITKDEDDFGFVISLPANQAKIASDLPKLKTSGRNGFRFFKPTKRQREVSVCGIASDAKPPRIYCAKREEDILEMAPYLGEQLNDWKSTDQLNVRVSGDPMRKFLGKLVAGAAVDMTRTERTDQVKESLISEAAAFVGDVDGGTMDFSWLDTGMKLRVRATLARNASGPKSALARTLVSDSKKSFVPAEVLSRMPDDVRVAFATRGVEPNEIKAVSSVAMTVLQVVLEGKENTKDAAKSAVDVLRARFLTGGPIAVAWGIDRARAVAAMSDYAKQKDSPARRAPVITALGGYTLVHVDEPVEPWIDAWKKLSALDRARRSRQGVKLHSQLLDAAPSAALPKGNFHFVRKEEAVVGGTPASTFHVFLVPFEGKSWLVAGREEALCIRKIKEVMAGPKSNLGKVWPALADAPRDARSVMAVSMAGLILLTDNPKYDHSIQSLSTKLAKYKDLPARGDAPILFVDRLVNEGEKPAIELDVNASAEVINDFIALETKNP